MKYFILLHNRIMMTQATILNSVEAWTQRECNTLAAELRLDIDMCWQEKRITDYQRKTLMKLANAIENLVE